MRAKSRTMSDVLFGKARSAILALLYGHPHRSYYFRQITRLLRDISPGNLQRELGTLTEIGLVHRSMVGRQAFYQANRAHPVFSELSGLVEKTVGTFHVLTRALASLRSRIAIAFVYGSVARREEGAESDVDLLIVGKVKLEDVLLRLANAEKTIGRAVNPTVYSPTEFKSRLADGNHFLNSVIRGEKIFLIGSEDELRKMAGVRVAESRSHKSQRD